MTDKLKELPLTDVDAILAFKKSLGKGLTLTTEAFDDYHALYPLPEMKRSDALLLWRQLEALIERVTAQSKDAPCVFIYRSGERCNQPREAHPLSGSLDEDRHEYRAHPGCDDPASGGRGCGNSIVQANDDFVPMLCNRHLSFDSSCAFCMLRRGYDLSHRREVTDEMVDRAYRTFLPEIGKPFTDFREEIRAALKAALNG